MRKVYQLVLVAIIVLAADGLVKLWINRWLEPGDFVPVLNEVFRLTLAYNTGVAFGMLEEGGSGLLVLTGTIIIALAIWALYSVYATKTPRNAYLPLGLLLGGAIANFVDRVMDGQVTDFLDIGLTVWRWPTFNLADCAIVAGVGLLMLMFWNHHEPHVVESGATYP